MTYPPVRRVRLRTLGEIEAERRRTDRLGYALCAVLLAVLVALWWRGYTERIDAAHAVPIEPDYETTVHVESATQGGYDIELSDNERAALLAEEEP